MERDIRFAVNTEVTVTESHFVSQSPVAGCYLVQHSGRFRLDIGRFHLDVLPKKVGLSLHVQKTTNRRTKSVQACARAFQWRGWNGYAVWIIRRLPVH